MLTGLEVEMFKENQCRKVRCGSITTDAQSLPLQLFRSGYAGTAEDGGIIKAFNSSNKLKVESPTGCPEQLQLDRYS